MPPPVGTLDELLLVVRNDTPFASTAIWVTRSYLLSHGIGRTVACCILGGGMVTLSRQLDTQERRKGAVDSASSPERDASAGRYDLLHEADESESLGTNAIDKVPFMDQKVVSALEEDIEGAILGLITKGVKGRRIPLLPSHQTIHLMAKAAVVVYETAVEVSEAECRDAHVRSGLG